MRPSRVAGASVIVLIGDAARGRGLFEGCGLIDGDATGVVLVATFRKDKLGRKRITASTSRTRGCGRGRQIVAIEVEVLKGLCHGARLARSIV